MKANENIRKQARIGNVPFWKLGQEFGVSEQTIVRWLRIQLSLERETEMLAAIEKLSAKSGRNNDANEND